MHSKCISRPLVTIRHIPWLTEITETLANESNIILPLYCKLQFCDHIRNRKLRWNITVRQLIFMDWKSRNFLQNSFDPNFRKQKSAFNWAHIDIITIKFKNEEFYSAIAVCSEFAKLKWWQCQLSTGLYN